MLYSYCNIFKQILFSAEKTDAEHIILMEHDCLYPEDYVPSVMKCLSGFANRDGSIGKDFAYGHCRTTFLNYSGFFDINEETYTLSKCSFKKNN